MHARHPVSLTARLSMLGFLLVATSACGFLFTHAPPEGHEQMDYFTCTERNVGPSLDVVLAGLYAAGTIMVAADPDRYESSGAYIGYGISGTVVFSAAAVVGFNKTEECRAAKRAWAERRAQGQAEATESPWPVMPPFRPDSYACVTCLVPARTTVQAPIPICQKHPYERP
jgi:hypothetical protein